MSVVSRVEDDLRVNTLEVLTSASIPGVGSGTVTNTSGALIAHAVVVGNGGNDEKTIAADTVTTHALFATATDPAFRVIAGSDLPNPSATTLGGIESLAAVSHKWINTISTSGVPSATQPAAADLSDGTTGSGTVVLSVSPALTGTPTAPTQAAGDNTTDIATDAFVTTAVSTARAAAFMLPVFVL